MAILLDVRVPHALGGAAARRLIDARMSDIEAALPPFVRDARGEWHDDVFAFGMTAFREQISGTISILETGIRVEATLPALAAPFERTIADAIRVHLETLISPRKPA
ncbi:polyhydroxyalkanoic acid system family protein [Chelatococcus reniformis]|uniref:Polyhydroxyalkanoic acid synthase n=1 Tax=Chelatococcus reniformis TaxID=1494448 RepID=A0A916U3I9_9HYPH|nr:polyhydroxyalkanoic acid system family protein [Chelatococcus reniformis]GGC57519.1 hypothetical protein GCM10010994_15630 [Chelatococcus reniformis]